MTIFLFFLYIFDFEIIKGISVSYSPFLVLVILLVVCFTNSDYQKTYIKVFNFSNHLQMLKMMIFLILLSILCTVVQGGWDFSYASVLLHQLIYVEIGVMLVSFCLMKGKSIFDSVFKSFVVQSFIQFACYLSPKFLSVTDVFRNDVMIARRQLNYSGFRGLAISSNAFFGLAVGYTVLFVLLAINWDTAKKKNKYCILYIPFLIFGALSAGRTSIFGIAFFALYRGVQVSKNTFFSRKTTKATYLKGFVVIQIIVFIIMVARLTQHSAFMDLSKMGKFSEYLLQMFSEDESGNYHLDFSQANSYSHLMNDMYFRISLKQFLIGDGIYTNSAGKYYMNTDAGYMRNLLYWGVIGSSIIYFYFAKIISYVIPNRKMQIIVFIVFAIVEIKGQVMGLLIMSQCILLLMIYNNYGIEGDDKDETNNGITRTSVL